MNTIIKGLSILGVCILLCCWSGCEEEPSPGGDPPPLPDPGAAYSNILDDPINAAMQDNRIPGLSVAVVRKNEIAWTKGYGKADISGNVSVDVETRFMLNQTADIVLAAAVLQVVDKQLADLDQNVNAYLPFKVINPQYPSSQISLRMLLSHTSGIVDDQSELASLYVEGDSDLKLGDFLSGYLTMGGTSYSPDHFSNDRPGKLYQYSRVGLSLAAFVVEQVANVDFNLFCQTHLFSQLGLINSSWVLRDMDQSKVAIPYSQVGNRREAQDFYGYPMYPSGQLRTSAEHMARFLLGLIQEGRYGGQVLLGQRSYEAMLDIPFPFANGNQALGWQYANIAGRPLLGMGGSDIGQSSRMYLDPATEIGVVLLSNGAGYGNALDDIMRQVFDAAERN